MNIQQAFNSLKEDHSPEALQVWSDFFKEQGLERMAICLLWCGKENKWPAFDDVVSQDPWYFATPVGMTSEQRTNHWILPFPVFTGLDKTKGYAGCRNYSRMEYALADLCASLHRPCEKCRGCCITFEVDHDNPGSSAARFCKHCKGTGLESMS